MTKSQKAPFRLAPYQLLVVIVALAILLAIFWPVLKSTAVPEVVVYKSPTCGCCSKWVSHLESNGFSVKTIDTNKLNIVKQNQNIPQHLSSCHTAIVNGYIVEGHVPANAIRRMLKEKPVIKGLTVPGMPIGSPGMEQGERKDPYDVLAIQHNNSIKVYESYRN